MKIILVMGLPGAGKTTLANEMSPLLNAKRLNADEVRKAANDWDFSEEGRVRQAKRMAEAALKLKAEGHYVIADFIAPTPQACFRQILECGSTQSKKEDLTTLIKCLLILKILIFM